MFTDNFNRSNGALGANWTATGPPTIQIVSNAAALTSLGGSDNFGIARCVAGGDLTDQRVRVTIASFPSDPDPTNMGVEVAARMLSDLSQGVALGVHGNEWFLYYWTASGDTRLDDGSLSDATTLELRVIGDTITAFVDDSQVAEVDATGLMPSSGYAGFNIYRFGSSNSPSVDDFEAEDLGGMAGGSGAARRRRLICAA